jgi:hypothetical protein
LRTDRDQKRGGALGKIVGMRNLHQLLIHITSEQAKRILPLWSWLLKRPYRLLFLSLFGDLFLMNKVGTIYMINLTAGRLEKISDSEAEFQKLLITDRFQREYLLAHLVEQLDRLGVSMSPSECYAFKTPPVFGGALGPDNVMPWDLEAYESGMSKVLKEVIGLPSDAAGSDNA